MSKRDHLIETHSDTDMFAEQTSVGEEALSFPSLGLAYFLVLEPNSASFVPLPQAGEALIGRAETAEIRLSDLGSSRHQARLWISSRGVEIQDLGSHNGTCVNGERLVGRRALASGDVISVAKVSLYFHAGGSAAAIVKLKEALERLSEEKNRELREENERRRLAEDDLRRAHEELRLAHDGLEERVTERTKELAAANRALEQARVAAEASSRAKSTFLANMSHELRTPLNAIIGYSELLIEEASDLGSEVVLSDLKKIHTASAHLLQLISKVLDLAKIEAGHMELSYGECEVRSLLGDVIAATRPLADKNGNGIEIDCAPELGGLRVDVTKLRQALINLVGNACKFTTNGRIAVCARRGKGPGREDWVRFEISDTGIGISEENVGRLFEDFHQVDPSSTKVYPGSGLGLAISRRFCRMMGGEVSVRSTVGVGSTFTIELPSRPELIERAAVFDSADVEAPGRPTALIIDDDPQTRDLLSRSIAARQLGVITASDGDEGLELARSHLPSMIFLDVLMPRMDGWRTIATLKADPELAAIPVIMVSIVEHASAGLALGAADFLTKPVERRRLIQVLERYARPRPPGRVHLVDSRALAVPQSLNG